MEARLWTQEQQIDATFQGYLASDFLLQDCRLFLSLAAHMKQHHSEKEQEQWLESIAMARLQKTQAGNLTMTSSRLFMHNWLIQAEVVSPPANANTTPQTALNN
jgi:hypothetical protein